MPYLRGMGYQFEHLYLRFNGSMGTVGGAEKWSVGMRFGVLGADVTYDTTKLQAFVSAAKTAADTFHAASGVNTGLNVYHDYVTGARIGKDGKYSPTGAQTIFSANSPAGGVGSAIMPWNTCQVFSLRTGVPRGRGSNGRVYWPAVAQTVSNTDGRVLTASTTTRVNAFKTFVNALNTAATNYQAGLALIVASNLGGGLNERVIAIRSDNRLDSIERRENKAVPVWTQVTIP